MNMEPIIMEHLTVEWSMESAIKAGRIDIVNKFLDDFYQASTYAKWILIAIQEGQSQILKMIMDAEPLELYLDEHIYGLENLVKLKKDQSELIFNATFNQPNPMEFLQMLLFGKNRWLFEPWLNIKIPVETALRKTALKISLARHDIVLPTNFYEDVCVRIWSTDV